MITLYFSIRANNLKSVIIKNFGLMLRGIFFLRIYCEELFSIEPLVLQLVYRKLVKNLKLSCNYTIITT